MEVENYVISETFRHAEQRSEQFFKRFYRKTIHAVDIPKLYPLNVMSFHYIPELFVFVYIQFRIPIQNF